KYDLFTFVPKNLFEQFRRLANLYFLFVAGLSIAPILGGFAPFLTFLPLIFIITVTAIKDAIEDWKRRKSDETLNNSPVTSYFDNGDGQDPAGRSAQNPTFRRKVPHSVLNHIEPNSGRTVQPLSGDGAHWQDCTWQDVKVGDIVYLMNDDPIPADIVILSTSEPDGLCFIETKNLDGETNLKIRRGLNATAGIRTAADVERAAFYVESEAPHANLYSYQGALKWLVSDGADMPASNRVVHNKTESITINEVLLRGCVLRNTEYIIGMVLFTGTDTKILLNSGATPSKRSRIEKDLNFHIVMNFIILFALSIGSAIANGVIFSDTHNNSATFFEFGADADTPFMSAFITFWSCLILYQNIVPISLYISIEIVKTAQAYFIHKDLDMYDERVDQACTPKTWNISDDLGQIEYIFSDKTGTLTQNVMEFQKCTINGIDYGIGETDATRGQKVRGDGEFEPMEFESDEEYLEKLGMERINMKAAMDKLFLNKYYSDKTTFIDSDLFMDMADPNSKHAKAIVNFWTALAVCHTVLAERSEEFPNRIEYKAQSPDEAALVSTARDVGFVFLEKQGPKMILEIMGQPRTYEVLNILEFNSTRKRMSIILRPPEGGIVLVCKGADSVIYERLDINDEQSKLREDTLVDLERFANEGLRTLCLAYRKISEEEYKGWLVNYEEASGTIHNREENIENVCEEIEHSMLLLGGTAIEDRLQEGVPECIALLSRAGIKLWVLTGDKVETAINIGFACNLLQKDMILIIIQAQDKDETLEQMRKALDKFWGREAQKDPELMNKTHALIIDGETLKHALSPDLNGMLLDVGKRCRSVICCRVSPLQKAKVVSMVKRGLDVMTLSIGDGANDVSMIQEANIGVGIAGEEGRQAVMASDFAIAQFRFLSKLLLVHGRWSYIRISEMILTFFYKNVVWTLTLFWFQFYSGFTALLLFDYTFVILYNLLFTSLPVMFMGAFDQDVDAETSMQFPALYLRGIKQKHFTRSKFWLYVLDALYQSLICFFVPLYISNDIYINGRSTNDIVSLGTLISGCSVVVANLYMGLNMLHWTKMIFGVIFGSIIAFFLYSWIYANFFTIDNPFYGMDVILLASPGFWFAILLSVILTMLPHYVYKFARQYLKPNDIVIVREQLYREKHPSKKERRAKKMKAMAMRETVLNARKKAKELDQDRAPSINSHMLRDDEMEDVDLGHAPIIHNTPTILSPKDPDNQKPGDIRQRQASPIPSMNNRPDDIYLLKGTPIGDPSSNLAPGSGYSMNQNSPFEQQGYARAGTLEPSSAYYEQHGYPSPSFTFNQESASAAATGHGATPGQISRAASKTTAGERPKIKRQSTVSIPAGNNFTFMGNDSSPTTSHGGPTGPGHTGFAFSADDASAFKYNHLSRAYSSPNEARIHSAAAARAERRESQQQQPPSARNRHESHGSRHSLDGGEVRSIFDIPRSERPAPAQRPENSPSPPPRCDTTAVEARSRRDSLARRHPTVFEEDSRDYSM
ncbi:hypothetical protein BGW38_009159, partial [Lunasporangiospora selenospora]